MLIAVDCIADKLITEMQRNHAVLLTREQSEADPGSAEEC